jgi:hypothetical protein
MIKHFLADMASIRLHRFIYNFSLYKRDKNFLNKINSDNSDNKTLTNLIIYSSVGVSVINKMANQFWLNIIILETLRSRLYV